MQDYKGVSYIFKIYLSDSNTPLNNLNLDGFDASFLNTANEVLLLPFFAFQVVKNEQIGTGHKIMVGDNEIEEQVYEITLVELPSQNQLKQREVVQTSLIWFDSEFTDEYKLLYRDALQRTFLSLEYALCDSEETFIQALNSSVKSVVILSGKDGAKTIPKLYGGLKVNNCITSIIVFCEIENQSRYNVWTQEYPIVRLMTNNLDAAVDMASVLVTEAKNM